MLAQVLHGPNLTSAISAFIRTYSEETAKQRPGKFLGRFVEFWSGPFDYMVKGGHLPTNPRNQVSQGFCRPGINVPSTCFVL